MNDDDQPEMMNCPACNSPMPREEDRCPRCLVSRKDSARFWRQMWTMVIIGAIVLVAAVVIMLTVAHRLDWPV